MSRNAIEEERILDTLQTYLELLKEQSVEEKGDLLLDFVSDLLDISVDSLLEKI